MVSPLRTAVVTLLCLSVVGLTACNLTNLLGGTTPTATLAVVVHNFHNNSVQAIVGYANSAGVQREVLIDADGVSPIPTQTTGAEEITFADIATDLTITVSFPNEAGVADVVVNQALSALSSGDRLRLAVTGNTAADVFTLIE